MEHVERHKEVFAPYLEGRKRNSTLFTREEYEKILDHLVNGSPISYALQRRIRSRKLQCIKVLDRMILAGPAKEKKGEEM